MCRGWLMLACFACTGDDAPPKVSTPPTPGMCDDAPTWDSFAKGFTTSWCTPCHAAALPEEQRQGAPLGVDLDTLADVIQWEARVHARTVERRDMPPGGGPSDEELRLLDAFLSCGLPGVQTPAAPCEAPTPYDGSPTVLLPTDVEALCGQGEVVVDGDLTIEGDVGELSCVCEVTGRLIVGHEVELAQLPRLSRAGGILARDSHVQGRLSLPALEVADGDIDVEGYDTIELPVLRTVNGQLRIWGPRQVDLDRLATVEQDFLVSLGALAELTVPRLTTAASVQVSDATDLAALRFDSLSECNSLTLTGLPQLELQGGFDSLRSLQDTLIVQGVGTSQLVGLSELAHVKGDVLLDDLPQLQRVEDLRALATVDGDLIVSAVPFVDPLVLEAWADEITVGGSVSLAPQEPAR